MNNRIDAFASRRESRGIPDITIHDRQMIYASGEMVLPEIHNVVNDDLVAGVEKRRRQQTADVSGAPCNEYTF